MTVEQKQKYLEIFKDTLDDVINTTLEQAQTELKIENGDISPMMAFKLDCHRNFVASNMLEILIQQEVQK